LCLIVILGYRFVVAWLVSCLLRFCCFRFQCCILKRVVWGGTGFAVFVFFKVWDEVLNRFRGVFRLLSRFLSILCLLAVGFVSATAATRSFIVILDRSYRLLGPRLIDRTTIKFVSY